MLQRNSQVFTKPHEFLPERFSKENSEKISKYDFLPFSGGQRNCIGKEAAMKEIKIMTAHLLRNYRIEASGTTNDLKLVIKITFESLNGIYIRLHPRLRYEYS